MDDGRHWFEDEDYDDDWCEECNHVTYQCTCYCPQCGGRIDHDCLCYAVPDELRLPNGA